MLVSRFLLDLQEAHQRKVVVLGSDSPLDTLASSGSCVDCGGSRARPQSRIAFQLHAEPALGALGATIDPVDWEDEDEDEDEDEGSSQGSVSGPPLGIRDEYKSLFSAQA